MLDNEKSVRKILFALRDCRKSSIKGESTTVGFSSGVKRDAKKEHENSKPKKSRPPIVVKDFDDTAQLAIMSLLSNEELGQKMEIFWGDELASRRPIMEAEVR